VSCLAGEFVFAEAEIEFAGEVFAGVDVCEFRFSTFEQEITNKSKTRKDRKLGFWKVRNFLI
jgi:hypothetical protein